MGRFGNQVDQFLGTLSLAMALNRTLVLMPWIDFSPYNHKPVFIDFEYVFDVKAFGSIDVISANDFFAQSDVLWQNRDIFCYGPRNFLPNLKKDDCNAKYGSPFSQFWDKYDVNFTKSQFYADLPIYTATDINKNSQAMKIKMQWDTRFPPTQYPVLAFVSSPGPFPVKTWDRPLQRHLVWSKNMRYIVKQIYYRLNFKPFTYLSIHLRNGQDWIKTCKHVGQLKQLFSSPQCLGEKNEYGLLTNDLCFPNTTLILQTVTKRIKEFDVKIFYVASDNDFLFGDLQKTLGNEIQIITTKNISNLISKLNIPQKMDGINATVNTYQLQPLIDLYILARGRHFIGNCVSSFTAFVKRERDFTIPNNIDDNYNMITQKWLETSFWGFDKSLMHTNFTHNKDEL